MIFEEIIIKRPAFGIDVLFNIIYHIFQLFIVDIKKIDKIKNVEQLFSFLKKNILYKPFQQFSIIYKNRNYKYYSFLCKI